MNENEFARSSKISAVRLANSFALYARRIVISPGLILERKRFMRARIRNNYNSLYEKNIF